MQLVGYSRTPEAGLTVATDGTVEHIPLERGRELAFELGERSCAGAVLDGTHQPCTSDEVPHCELHTDTWICARCRGTCLKDEMDCHQPHVVYLAIVAPDHVKVGVTKAHRIETRLHEQGADRGVTIHRVKNGRIAREIEAEIGEEVPERIPISAKIAGITREVDESAWETVQSSFDVRETYEPEYELAPTSPPIPDTLATGRVVGTKGRLVLLELGGSTYVTDLRDLVGHYVSETTAGPERQTGLGAFS